MAYKRSKFDKRDDGHRVDKCLSTFAEGTQGPEPTQYEVNLNYAAYVDEGIIENDSGDDAFIPAGSTNVASLILPEDTLKLNSIFVGARLQSVVAGTDNVTIDNTDPANPVINVSEPVPFQHIFYDDVNVNNYQMYNLPIPMQPTSPVRKTEFDSLSTQVSSNSASITTLQGQVTANTSDISENTTDITSLNSSVALINQTLVPIGGDISDLQGDVTALQSQMATKLGKTETAYDSDRLGGYDASSFLRVGSVSLGTAAAEDLLSDGGIVLERGSFGIGENTGNISSLDSATGSGLYLSQNTSDAAWTLGGSYPSIIHLERSSTVKMQIGVSYGTAGTAGFRHKINSSQWSDFKEFAQTGTGQNVSFGTVTQNGQTLDTRYARLNQNVSFGDVTCSNLDVTTTSDERVKTEVKGYSTTTEALAELMLLRGKYTKDAGPKLADTDFVGSLAQVVEKSFPECVTEVPHEKLGTLKQVDYVKLGWMLSLAQNEKIFEQEQRIKELEQIISQKDC